MKQSRSSDAKTLNICADRLHQTRPLINGHTSNPDVCRVQPIEDLGTLDNKGSDSPWLTMRWTSNSRTTNRTHRATLPTLRLWLESWLWRQS
jgi:hypothetical protein